MDGNVDLDLVVSSIVSPDSTFKVKVEHTSPVFGDQITDFNVENAEVVIFNRTNNERIELSHSENGVYCSGVRPLEGHTYEIQVEADGYEKVFGTTAVPSINSVEVYDFSLLSQGQNNQSVKVELEIDVPFGTENFYAWEFKITDKESTLVPEEEENIPSDSGLEDVFGDFSFAVRDFTTLTLVKDNDIKEGKLTAIIDDYEVSNETMSIEDILETKDITIRIIAVSEEFYNHISQINFVSSTASSITIPGEPYSNILNGYGIFGAYNQKYVSL